jgi:anti-sigma factor RsiW
MRRELTCRELVELVTEYLDGGLSRRDRRRFERHLAGCDACPRYVEQIRVTIRLAGRDAAERQVEGLDGLRAAFRDWHATKG